MSSHVTAEQLRARLEAASRLSNLDAELRLVSKIDMSPEGVTARLREAAELLECCRHMARLRPSAP
jgi:hypothetical protein